MSRKTIEKNISYDDLKKLYYVNMDYGKDQSGKRIKKTTTFQTKAEARQALKSFEGKKAAEDVVVPRQITLADWLNYWLTNIVVPNKEAGTVYFYKQIIDNHITPKLGKIALQKLTPQQIQCYYREKADDIKNPLTTNTIRKHHDLLKTALKFAVKQDVLLRNPVDRVEPPKLKETEKGFYTPEDLTRLFEQIEGNRLELVVKLAGYLGLRREEICGLRWEAIDYDKRTVQIRCAMTSAGSQVIVKGPKNKTSSRTLHLPDELLQLLKKEQLAQEYNKAQFGEEYQNSGFVIQWPNGKPYRPNYLSEIFTKFVMEHGLPKITLHELRHTFATIANSRGASLFDIGKALGHSTPSTTGKIYTHLMDKTNEDTINAVAGVIISKTS